MKHYLIPFSFLATTASLLLGCAQTTPAFAQPPVVTATAAQASAASTFVQLAQVTPTGAATTPVATPEKLDPLTLGWPRLFDTNGLEFAVYQPQVSRWPSNRIEGRFALAVRPAGTSNETYGVAFFQARTEIDKVNRLVTMEDLLVTKVDFPTEPRKGKGYQSTLQRLLPHAAKTIPLDHLESAFVVSGEIAKAKIVAVDNTPPRIIFTTQPALLVQVDGPPVLKPLVPGYERIVNTQAALFYNTNLLSQGYYLRAAMNWYTAPSLEGPWTVDPTPPPDIQTALDAALATKQVDALETSPTHTANPLNIYVATTPAELIQTSGTANMLSVAGTDLLYVANTSNAVFYYLDDANYYILISGRWFKAPSLYGPWAFVAPTQLPEDFKKIPSDSPKSNVLVSVAGTPQAQEAVIANTIPETVTIDRAKAELTVPYVGAPSFAPVAGTGLHYATNTVTPVVMVGLQSYYACQNGVWFTSTSASGPWLVATTVPAVIYTIPASCPIHYVTYSYVYGATSQYVYVGYTPGYMGTVLAPGGVVVYGTGYYYPPVVVGTTYIAYPPTYGYGASLALGAAVGFAFGYAAGADYNCWYHPCYGPYATSAYYHGAYYGYGHVNCGATSFYTSWGTAVHATGAYGYNPYTGTSWGAQHASTYNPYTGTSGAANRAAAYNPYTGTAAAGHNAAAYNPYTGARGAARGGATANAYTGNYAAGRQATGYNPTTGMYGATSKGISGNAYTGAASGYNRGVAGNASTGNKVAWNNGNVYTDRNGNVNAYNSSTGSWNKYGSSGWQNADRSTASSMDRESWGQSMGSDRFDSWNRGGGGGWGGSSHSWGGGGWGGFHGGGFRR